MRSLPLFLNCRGRAVILVGEGEAAAAKRRLLERAGARIVGEDEPASLAIVALPDPEATVARLRKRGIFVNAVDRPDLCDFTLPAILDRDPVTIAISTGGASAGLAKALRQRLEAMLPANLGALAEALHAARAIVRSRWPDATERRRAIDEALAPGGPLDPWADSGGDWEKRVALALGAKRGKGSHEPRFEVIRLRSADPDDLTVREARLLGAADRIYHRPGIPPAILDRARADAARIACGAAPTPTEAGLSIDLDWERP
jgi:uroporphyrin-III C-methyltransferase/precorrin-2 dehydrogenase/sirohydrochlorin ferrochelatase